MAVPTILPSANTLFGPILDQQYEQIVKGWCCLTVDRYGSLQSDSRKNKRKQHLVTISRPIYHAFEHFWRVGSVGLHREAQAQDSIVHAERSSDLNLSTV
jgi:hypothetical protein